MDAITIEAVPAPTNEVRELIAELDHTLGADYDPSQKHGLSFEGLFQPHFRFFIARLDGRPAGCGGVALFETFAEVKRMYVREAVRGRGVAQALLAHIEATAAESGYGILRLETGVRQFAAIKLYERAGFEPRDAFGVYVSMTPFAISTSLFYEKRLSQ